MAKYLDLNGLMALIYNISQGNNVSINSHAINDTTPPYAEPSTILRVPND